MHDEISILNIPEFIEKFFSLDDIEDNSLLRKNKPSAHTIFGVGYTVNSAAFGFFIMLQKLMKLLPRSGAELYRKSMLEYSRGTGMEIYYRESQICPSQSEYIRYTLLKNLGFWHFQAKLVQMCGNNKQDFSRLTALFCTFHQISNDYSEFVTNGYSEGKMFCDDLTEGKFNFPTIHAVKEMKSKDVYGKRNKF